MFVDRVKIKVRGGDGGHGCMSFRREKFVPKGGPDGGDGGKGGDVIFEATANEMNLNAMRYLNHYEGKNGQGGMGKNRHGKNGDDCIVKVPIGTVIKDIDFDLEIICDMTQNGQRYVAASGGHGGRGNTHFLTNTNRAPRRADEGIPGEERYLELELKTIADIGLVGYPNAGKSSLLEALTNASPETAPYPFTTLHPHVGIKEYKDYFRITIADIPGLIEGASENVGLGHAFLRHIERTKLLVMVLDMNGTDNRDPWDDMASLFQELELYQPGLSERVTMIAANKMDEPKSAENIAILKTKTDLPIYEMSAPLLDQDDSFTEILRKEVELVLEEELKRGHEIVVEEVDLNESIFREVTDPEALGITQHDEDEDDF
ncbi:MAG: GTPase ObgE [Lentisphaeria bacterium]|nr:GTPase ObgE [Lentisphaeria bacterium]